jgi:ATP dependent DNA ligase domain
LPRREPRRYTSGMPLVTGFIPPCIPTRAHRVPSGPDWVHEIKHDGYRLQVRREGDAVRLFTRRGHDWSGRYPAIVMTAMQLRATSFTLDGEAVVCGPDGVAIFDALHRRGTVSEAMLYAYLLALEGQILLSLQYPQFALSSDKIVFGDAEVIGTEEGVGRRGGLFTLPFCGARSPRVVPRAPLASVRQTSRICGSPRLIGTSDPDANGDGRPARGCGRGSCRNGMRNRDRNAGVISCWGDLERSDENTA